MINKSTSLGGSCGEQMLCTANAQGSGLTHVGQLLAVAIPGIPAASSFTIPPFCPASFHPRCRPLLKYPASRPKFCKEPVHPYSLVVPVDLEILFFSGDPAMSNQEILSSFVQGAPPGEVSALGGVQSSLLSQTDHRPAGRCHSRYRTSQPSTRSYLTSAPPASRYQSSHDLDPERH